MGLGLPLFSVSLRPEIKLNVCQIIINHTRAQV